MSDESPSLKPIADVIMPAIESADASPANVVPLAGKRASKGRRRRDPQRSEIEPNAGEFSVEKINRDYALVIMGSKVVIVRESGVTRTSPSGVQFLVSDAFLKWYANRFTEHRDQHGQVKSVSWATAWMSHPQRRQYEGIEFFPNLDGAAGTPSYFNLWHGFAFEPKANPNGYKTLRDHLLTNVCGSDEQLFNWIFGWFAHMIQRPGERIGVALVLMGIEGAGKTVLGEAVGALFPSHFRIVDMGRYVVGQFNMHMMNCLLLQADEAVWAGDKDGEGALKGLITSEIRMVEPKGIDAFPVGNFVRLYITSNEKMGCSDWRQRAPLRRPEGRRALCRKQAIFRRNESRAARRRL